MSYFGFSPLILLWVLDFSLASWLRCASTLFDYLYFRSLPKILSHYNLDEDLRLNLDEFTSEEQEEFAGYVMSRTNIRMGGAKMARIMQNLERHVW
jgi:hypothetical protein